LAWFVTGHHAAEPMRAVVDDTKPTAKAPYVHTVFFTVKKDAPEGAADALIADAHELLEKIPSVREIRSGKPAEKSSPGAQKSYSVGLVVLFDDYDGLKTYLDHELHLKYVERNLKNIDEKKLLVYDFLNPKK
jgi:hypothetical protein